MFQVGALEEELILNDDYEDQVTFFDYAKMYFHFNFLFKDLTIILNLFLSFLLRNFSNSIDERFFFSFTFQTDFFCFCDLKIIVT